MLLILIVRSTGVAIISYIAAALNDRNYRRYTG